MIRITTFPKLKGELTLKGEGNYNDILPSYLTISYVLYPILPRDAAASLRESR